MEPSNRKRSNIVFRSAALGLLLLSLASLAFAKDDISVSVPPISGATVETAGQGQIKVTYPVTGFCFTAGTFGSFTVNLGVAAGNGQATTYPATMNLTQTASPHLTLSANPSSFSVSGLGWADSSTVTVTVPNNITLCREDGAVLVGQLNVEGSDFKSTPHNVHVTLKLVHPTSCLKVYDFITSQNYEDLQSVLVINNTNKGTVVATNPGQLSDNIMVANTCPEPRVFDLKIALDTSFDTNPHNNPGNAVFTYYTSGVLDPNGFQLALQSPKIKQGEKLCLGDINLPGYTTFLATVHMGIINGITLGSSGSSGTFTFGGDLRAPNATLGLCNGALLSDAVPNPYSASLPYTIR